MFDAIFLDCDGVITDRKARVDGKVVFEAYRLAHAGKKIAFVTGRSLGWFSKNLLPVLAHFNPTAEEKRRFFFVGECGNRWLSFSGNNLVHGADNSHLVPESVRVRIRNEVSRFPYLSFDETKESFVSLEIRHEKAVSPQAEREARRQLDDAREFFSTYYPEFTVLRTLYAVDILPEGIGKASAVRRAL